MTSLPRTLSLSLLLHSALFFCLLNYLVKEREKPVVVDISLSQLPEGAPGNSPGARGKRGGGAALMAAAANRRAAGAALERRHSAAALPGAVQSAVPAAPNSGPAAPQALPVPQAATPIERRVLREVGAAVENHPAVGKPLSGGIATSLMPGGEAGRSGQSGEGGTAVGLSGTRGGGASAVGTGNGTGAGNSAEHARQKYLSEHFAYIQKIIRDHLVYPKKALRDGLAGRASVAFIVLEDGGVSNLRIVQSTGYRILDLNLLDTIKRCAPYPRPPIRAELRMSFTYRPEW